MNLDVFLTYIRTFSNREPIPFSKANALSYAHSKVGNDQTPIRGEITSAKWSLSGFVRSRPGSLLPRDGAFDLGLAVSVPLPIVTGIFVLLWFQSRLT